VRFFDYFNFVSDFLILNQKEFKVLFSDSKTGEAAA